MITPTSHAIDYLYDDLNRLIQVNYPTGQTISYAYDSVGNLLSVTLTDSNTDEAYRLLDQTARSTGTEMMSQQTFDELTHRRTPILSTLKADIESNVISVDFAGIALRKGNEDLKQALNGAITAIRDSGDYKKINDVYFDIDIYGAN